MAGFLPSSDYANVVHGFTAPNVDRPPSITFTVDISAFGGSPANLAANLHAAFASDMLAELDTQWALAQTDVYYGPTPSSIGGSLAQTNPGTQSGNAPPPNLAILVTKRTAFIGKKGTGRFYLPAGFITEEGIGESGELTTGTVDALQLAVDGWLAGVEGTVPMVLAHSGTVGDPPAEPPYTIQALDVDPLAATQRRRLRG